MSDDFPYSDFRADFQRAFWENRDWQRGQAETKLVAAVHELAPSATALSVEVYEGDDFYLHGRLTAVEGAKIAPQDLAVNVGDLLDEWAARSWPGIAQISLARKDIS